MNHTESIQAFSVPTAGMTEGPTMTFWACRNREKVNGCGEARQKNPTKAKARGCAVHFVAGFWPYLVTLNSFKYLSSRGVNSIGLDSKIE
jgi:hypothetical protein